VIIGYNHTSTWFGAGSSQRAGISVHANAPCSFSARTSGSTVSCVLNVGFGRTVTSEIEAPILLVDLVCSGRAVVRSDSAT
jgi:hypothetical protein